jgi:PHP family Zn ribbon phosphoesterase
MNRVCELADRTEAPPGGAPFRSLIALTEVLAEIEGIGSRSKRVARQYETLLGQIGPELFILEQAPLVEIRRAGTDRLAEAIRRMRAGEVHREPGYDGEYGTIRLFEPEELT